MKKVLIIGNFWPYTEGSKRIISLAKFLPKFGWEPIILTPPLDKTPDQNFRFIKTDYLGILSYWTKLFGLKKNVDLSNQLQKKVKNVNPKIKKILRYAYIKLHEIIAYPDESKNWKNFALKEAEKLIKKEKIDAIISNISPITSHIIACKLKKKYQIPWIADLTDLWSENAAYPYGLIRKWFDKKLEIKTLKFSDCITTASPPYVEKIKKLHKNKLVYSIYLGFDLDILNSPAPPLTKNFTITYTGIFYPNKRDPLKFIVALSELISEHKIDTKNIEVRFYSPENEKIKQDIKKYNLHKIIKLKDLVPFSECLKRQRESQILLQLNWEDKNDKGVFSGKLFDYLAATRPIIAAGGHGSDEVVKNILQKTKAGTYCPTIKDIKNFLLENYLEYKNNKKIVYKGNLTEVKKYSNQKLIKNFVNILNDI